MRGAGRMNAVPEDEIGESRRVVLHGLAVGMEGSVSDFTRHITWVVILALMFSLIESLWILPAHLARMKPRKDEGGGRFGHFQKGIRHILDRPFFRQDIS